MENLNKIEENFCFVKSDFLNFGLRPFSVLKQFEKMALKHAEMLNIGYYNMLKKNLLWVAMRIKYEVLRQPNENEMLKIVTYPSGKNMFEFDRDYLIFDGSDNLIIKGTSKWCLISSLNRKIAKVSVAELPECYNISPAFEGRFLKTETFIPETLADYSYQILPEDIDGNNHTNNTVYAKTIDALCKSVNSNVKFFQINFINETHLGERLDCFKKQTNDGILVLGKICEGETSFTAKVQFAS